MWYGVTHHVKCSVEVDLQYSVPFLFSHIEHHPVAQDTGYVVHHVDATEVVDSRLYYLASGLVVCNRIEVGYCGTTASLDLCHYLRSGSVRASHTVNTPAEVVNDDGCAFLCQKHCYTSTDPPAGASNNRYSPFKSLAHTCFLSQLVTVKCD